VIARWHEHQPAAVAAVIGAASLLEIEFERIMLTERAMLRWWWHGVDGRRPRSRIGIPA
jgi:hypothetical protein